MDHDTFSTIAHRSHRYLNPVGEATMSELFGLLHLGPGAQVFDAGCGKGEALIQLASLYGVDAVGVDRNRRFVDEGALRARELGVADQVELVACDIADYPVEADSFDAALCIGASHLYGGYRGALGALGELVRPGGAVIVGEGFWRVAAPDPDYLAFLGADVGDLDSHSGNLACARELGFEVLRNWVSSDDDWDAYEELYLAGIEGYAEDHADDPEVPGMLERIRAWHSAYQRWGRHDLGFGLYYLRRRS